MARKKNSDDYALQTIISKDAAEFLSALAKEDDRSLVKYTKRIIMKHLEEKGYVEKSKEHIKETNNKEETKKDITVSLETDTAKQSTNCSSSVSNIKKGRGTNTKVAPVPMSFSN